MRIDRNTKEDFLAGVTARIENGSWGLDEVEYLQENHSKYHLNYDDIGTLLQAVYTYTYGMAMEDGIVNQLENDELAQIQKLRLAPAPQNKVQRDNLKLQIMFLVKRFEIVNSLQEKVQLENQIIQEKALEPEPVKERVNSLYYKYPKPKLTPYTY